MPGLLHRCLSGLCWVPRRAALPAATSFGDKMPPIGSRQARGAAGHPCPHFPTLTIPPGIAYAQGGRGCTALPRGREGHWAVRG